MASSSSDLSRTLATKTTYFQPIDGTPTSFPAPDDETCAPIQINFVIRHGTRYPTADAMKRITSLAAMAKDHDSWLSWHGVKGDALTPPFDQLSDWEAPWENRDAGNLVPGGISEMSKLAKRVATAFPQLVNDDLKVKFESSKSQRAAESAAAFANALLASTISTPISTGSDKIFRPQKSCPRYASQVTRAGDYSLWEVQTYKTGTQMLAAASRVGARIGWKGFRIADLLNIFDACAAEIGVTGNTSSLWCQALSTEDIAPLLYLKDMEQYYTRGYGYAISYECSAGLLLELWSSITAAVRGDDVPKAEFRFGHTETILPLMALLGLYQDQSQLTADASPETIDQRLWNTSKIAPFSANLAFVLHECASGKRMQVMVNEQPVEIPGCKHTLCEPDRFFRAFKPYLQESTYDNLCDVHKAPDHLNTMVLALFAVSVIGLVSTTFGYTYWTSARRTVPPHMPLP